MYTVYIHVFPNDKVYIGITSLKAKYRWLNGNGYKSQKLVYRAIEKYGWENIKHIVLFTGLTKKEAEQKEIELISFYRSTDRNYGYNLDNGGSASERFTDEIKARISKSHKGKKQNADTIEKRRKALIKAHAQGKFDDVDRSFFQTEEYKSHQSKRMIDYWKDETKREKLCNALKTAMNDPVYKKNHSTIMKQISNKPEIKAKFSGSNNGKSKQCVCIETGTVYPCVAEASRKTNAPINSIALCCRGKRKTAGGFHWRYKTDFMQVIGGV